MTLTEAAYWTKRFGLITVAILAIIIVAIYTILNWPEPEKPNIYSKANFACTDTKEEFLEWKLNIPTLQYGAGSTETFGVETETGQIEALPRVANVFQYNNPGETLSSKAEAQVIAQQLGFDPEKIERKGVSEYTWEDPEHARSLTVQARNQNFTLKTDFSNPKAFSEETTELPTDENAIRMATSFLKSSGLLYEDQENVAATATLIELQPGGRFKMARSKGSADLIRVDFFRRKQLITVYESDNDYEEKIEELSSIEGIVMEDGSVELNGKSVKAYFFYAPVKSLKAEYDKSYISVYIGPEDDRKRGISNQNVYQIDYTYWQTDPTVCGTYEMIPASSAVDLIQQGKGSLVYLNEKNGDTVIDYTPKSVTKLRILKVYLAYYDPTEEQFNTETLKQGFMQPIYVIEGEATFDNSFLGRFVYYVPAIDYENTQDKREIEAPIVEEEEQPKIGIF